MRDWAEERGVGLPHVPAHCSSPWHLFHLVMPTPAARRGLLAALRARGILGTFHYLPLHSAPMGRRLGRCCGRLPVTTRVSARLLRLPLFFGLTPREQQRVIETVRAFKA